MESRLQPVGYSIEQDGAKNRNVFDHEEAQPAEAGTPYLRRLCQNDGGSHRIRPANKTNTATMKTPFDISSFERSINRRTFLSRSAYGLGGLALASLLNPALVRGATAAENKNVWK